MRSFLSLHEIGRELIRVRTPLCLGYCMFIPLQFDCTRQRRPVAESFVTGFRIPVSFGRNLLFHSLKLVFIYAWIMCAQVATFAYQHSWHVVVGVDVIIIVNGSRDSCARKLKPIYFFFNL
jgi:hypothetical protein